MSASQPQHPFTIAWETWQTWSDAEAMRTARRRTAARGDSLAAFDQHPEWTQGPGPLQALRANREVVDQLVGWRWAAMREAREQRHSWAEIGTALGADAEQARTAYLERVERQRLVHETRPDLRHLLGYDPRWAELAAPTTPTVPTSNARPAGGRPSGDRRAVRPSLPQTEAPGGQPPPGQRRSVTAMGKVQITIEVDDGRLGSYQDAHLAMCWHLAQANPAPHGDRAAGELVERIGREIIRRWLQATPPELWRHQGRDHSWQQLRQLATFTPGTGEVGSPQWHDGVWVPRTASDPDQGVADRP